MRRAVLRLLILSWDLRCTGHCYTLRVMAPFLEAISWSQVILEMHVLFIETLGARTKTIITVVQATDSAALQCATLAAGPGTEASENLVGPVKNGPGPVRFSFNRPTIPGQLKKNPNFANWHWPEWNGQWNI